MIILPDRNIPRAKVLLPMLPRAWRTPSQAQLKDSFGRENTMCFLVEARRGSKLRWQGFFDDREDFDEFIAALAANTLRQDGYLQRLPRPAFDPALLRDASIQYNFLTQATFTGSTTWSVPPDCTGIANKAGEFIDCIGGGGSGGGFRANSIYNASGGAGGAFARITSYALTPNGSAAITIGAGGAATSGSATQATNGNAGGLTYFVSTGVCYANGGGAGLGVTAGAATGGAAPSGGGAVAYAGGRGGNIGATPAATGGGGAAGPSGAGGAGVDGPATQTGSAGGGAGGASNVYGSWGPGAGGAGVRATVAGATAQGIDGGFYGGGGGAAGSSTNAASTYISGAGRSGLIVVRYEPVVPATLSSCTPNVGPTAGGTLVTLSGSNFSGITGVSFGGAAATSVANPNSTTITCVTPARPPGAAAIVVSKAGASPAGGVNFTYLPPSGGFNLAMPF
jgi:hypothetical protein